MSPASSNEREARAPKRECRAFSVAAGTAVAAHSKEIAAARNKTLDSRTSVDFIGLKDLTMFFINLSALKQRRHARTQEALPQSGAVLKSVQGNHREVGQSALFRGIGAARMLGGNERRGTFGLQANSLPSSR